MILQYVFNTGIQYFVWVLQHTLPYGDGATTKKDILGSKGQ